MAPKRSEFSLLDEAGITHPMSALPGADPAEVRRRADNRWHLLRRRPVLVALTAAALLVVACTPEDATDVRGDADDEGSVEPDSGEDRALEFDGPEENALINAEDLERLRFTVTATGDDAHVADLAIHLDEDDVTDGVIVDDTSLVFEPGPLDDGTYTVAVVATLDGSPDDGAAGDDAAGDGDDPAGDEAPQTTDHDAESEVLHEWAFEVDATAPEVELTSPQEAVIAGQPVVVAGTTEPGATVSIDGHEVDAGEDGAFELELDSAPDGEFEIVAVDRAGNRSEPESTRLVTVPSRVALDEIRAVHVTSHAWAHPGLRDQVLQMVDEGRINAVQLDLKDEGGRIGYDTEVELAIETGAAENVYTLEDAVAELHGRGIHIVGRIVAFRDPVLGQYALDNGHLDWLIQTPDGQPYTGRYPCCFTSFAHDDVIEYHLDIAEEAAAAGVDDILWDYIRRPDGSPDAMVVPGLSDDADGATLEEAVVDFAARADERLRPYGVGHGASLYGIAADRPTEIAQDVPALAEHLDYVAPMIYPSHWGPGEYGVQDPNRQPYDIITATLDVWKDATEGKRARVVPWLEDTNYRAWDRPHQVREQIRATSDQGIDEWLMWDPVVNYTREAYDRRDD